VSLSKLSLSRVLNFSGALGAVLLVTTIAAPQARSAEGSSIGGSWSGGGTVVYADGRRERASCRASYSGSGTSVSLSARCATPSGSIDQSASLRRTGPNSYSGSFFNPQYNVSGSIHVTVHGNTQSVSLHSGSGSASLTLRH
jgi:hypothetical protein